MNLELRMKKLERCERFEKFEKLERDPPSLKNYGEAGRLTRIIHKREFWILSPVFCFNNPCYLIVPRGRFVIMWRNNENVSIGFFNFK